MSQPEANPDEIVLVLEEIRPIPARQRIVMDQDTSRQTWAWQQDSV